MDYGWLNLGSLILGLIAWGIPTISLLLFRNKLSISYGIPMAVSLGSCSVSLFMQILYQNHLVIKEDWSALMDTSNAVSIVCAVLLAVTIILNAVTAVIYMKK